MTCYEWVPDLLTWLAHRNQEGSRDQITNEATPDANVDSHKQKHVASSGGDEDSEILKENRKLDKEDS